MLSESSSEHLWLNTAISSTNEQILAQAQDIEAHLAVDEPGSPSWMAQAAWNDVQSAKWLAENDKDTWELLKHLHAMTHSFESPQRVQSFGERPQRIRAKAKRNRSISRLR